MDAVHDTGIFNRQEQETFNWYRHFKGVHSILDMVCSNGNTIDPTIITQEAGQSFRDLPLQVLTGSDHTLWLKMIHSLTQAGHRLMRPLGVLKSLGIPTPRNPHYQALAISLVWPTPLSYPVTEYLASQEYNRDISLATTIQE
jgi:hypothetical protein